MEEFESDDHERPIETYPGFIGMTVDGDLYPEKPLRCLNSINWNRYYDLLEWAPDDHTIEVIFWRGPRQIRATYEVPIAWLLDQVPSIKVAHDPDSGSTPGGTAAFYYFFIADDASEEELEHDILALEAGLQSDFRKLEALHGQELDEIMRARKPG